MEEDGYIINPGAIEGPKTVPLYLVTPEGEKIHLGSAHITEDELGIRFESIITEESAKKIGLDSETDELKINLLDHREL